MHRDREEAGNRDERDGEDEGEGTEGREREREEGDGECRHCKPKLPSKINDRGLYYRYL